LLERDWKIFHFQELNWLIFFPCTGNDGRKYLYYSVEFLDQGKGKARAKVCLAEIVDSPEFEKSNPHTVGFFKGSVDVDEKKELGAASYLEIRIVRSVEEFWAFLNELNI